jgi:hypothetical protein
MRAGLATKILITQPPKGIRFQEAYVRGKKFRFQTAQNMEQWSGRPSDSLLGRSEVQTREGLSANTKSKRPQVGSRSQR